MIIVRLRCVFWVEFLMIFRINEVSYIYNIWRKKELFLFRMLKIFLGKVILKVLIFIVFFCIRSLRDILGLVFILGFFFWFVDSGFVFFYNKFCCCLFFGFIMFLWDVIFIAKVCSFIFEVSEIKNLLISDISFFG